MLLEVWVSFVCSCPLATSLLLSLIPFDPVSSRPFASPNDQLTASVAVLQTTFNLPIKFASSSRTSEKRDKAKSAQDSKR